MFQTGGQRFESAYAKAYSSVGSEHRYFFKCFLIFKKTKVLIFNLGVL